MREEVSKDNAKLSKQKEEEEKKGKKDHFQTALECARPQYFKNTHLFPPSTIGLLSGDGTQLTDFCICRVTSFAFASTAVFFDLTQWLALRIFFKSSNVNVLKQNAKGYLEF